MNIDTCTSDTKITFHIHLLKVVFLAVKFRLSDVEMWTHERDIVLKTNMCPADALNKHGGYNGTFCEKVGCFLPLINSSVIIITTEQIVPKQDIQIIYLSFVHISRYPSQKCSLRLNPYTMEFNGISVKWTGPLTCTCTASETCDHTNQITLSAWSFWSFSGCSWAMVPVGILTDVPTRSSSVPQPFMANLYQISELIP